MGGGLGMRLPLSDSTLSANPLPNNWSELILIVWLDLYIYIAIKTLGKQQPIAIVHFFNCQKSNREIVTSVDVACKKEGISILLAAWSDCLLHASMHNSA